MKRYSLILTGFALLAVTMVGCSNESEFKNSVVKLDDMNQVIKSSMESGDLDKAHGPLHDVGHVLESLSKAAQTEKFSEADMATINAAKDDLFDAFGEIDKTFHGKEGATYDEVANKIGVAMNKLKSFAGLEESPVEAPPVDDVPEDSVDEVEASAPEEPDS